MRYERRNFLLKKFFVKSKIMVEANKYCLTIGGSRIESRVENRYSRE